MKKEKYIILFNILALLVITVFVQCSRADIDYDNLPNLFNSKLTKENSGLVVLDFNLKAEKTDSNKLLAWDMKKAFRDTFNRYKYLTVEKSKASEYSHENVKSLKISMELIEKDDQVTYKMTYEIENNESKTIKSSSVEEVVYDIERIVLKTIDINDDQQLWIDVPGKNWQMMKSEVTSLDFLKKSVRIKEILESREMLETLLNIEGLEDAVDEFENKEYFDKIYQTLSKLEEIKNIMNKNVVYNYDLDSKIDSAIKENKEIDAETLIDKLVKDSENSVKVKDFTDEDIKIISEKLTILIDVSSNFNSRKIKNIDKNLSIYKTDKKNPTQKDIEKKELAKTKIINNLKDLIIVNSCKISINKIDKITELFDKEALNDMLDSLFDIKDLLGKSEKEIREIMKKGIITNFLVDSSWKKYRAESDDQLCTCESIRYMMHPMNCINTIAAELYCEEIGGTLLTEEDWEYVYYNGQTDKNGYFWGDKFDGNHAVSNVESEVDKNGDPLWKRYGSKENDYLEEGTAPVAAYGERCNEYGACDMAGNLWEWTSDKRYDGYRIIKGGAWDYKNDEWYKGKFQSFADHQNIYLNIGFRCKRMKP